MKAIVCNNFGPIRDIQYKEVDEPNLNEDSILIKVNSVGVNFPDGLLVQGKYQLKPETPFIPGMEVAGEVISLGSKNSDFKVGDRIAALSQLNGYAEKAVVKTSSTFKIPENMSYDDACALLCAYGTSHYALKQRGKLKKGETLVVLGASGSTGIAAIQIGKIIGAKVIAVASNGEKQKIAEENGADLSIGYDNLKEKLKEISGGKGIDVIFDPVGGDTFDTIARTMARKGRLLVIGFASGSIPKLAVNLALVKELLGSIRGKYASMPIPNGDVSLDGDTLRSEGAAERDALISELREDLESASKRQLMERQNDIANFQQETMNKMPYGIYIG